VGGWLDEGRDTFFWGACARTERQAGRRGRRAEVQSSARRLRRKPALWSRIRAARGTKFFSKMTVFFSTHSIENFASIYGS
jgi:hypothetical protein